MIVCLIDVVKALCIARLYFGSFTALMVFFLLPCDGWMIVLLLFLQIKSSQQCNHWKKSVYEVPGLRFHFCSLFSSLNIDKHQYDPTCLTESTNPHDKKFCNQNSRIFIISFEKYRNQMCACKVISCKLHNFFQHHLVCEIERKNALMKEKEGVDELS